MKTKTTLLMLFSFVAVFLIASLANAGTMTFLNPTAGSSVVGTYTFRINVNLNASDPTGNHVKVLADGFQICNITGTFTPGSNQNITCNYDTRLLNNGATEFAAGLFNSTGNYTGLDTSPVIANVLNPTADNTACQNTRSTIYVALGLVALFAIVGAAYGLVNIFNGGGEMASFSILAISIIALGVVVLVGYVLMSAVSSAVCTIV